MDNTNTYEISNNADLASQVAVDATYNLLEAILTEDDPKEMGRARRWLAQINKIKAQHQED